MIHDACSLENSADQKAKDAQAQRKFDLIVESNTLRDKAKEMKKDADVQINLKEGVRRK